MDSHNRPLSPIVAILGLTVVGLPLAGVGVRVIVQNWLPLLIFALCTYAYNGLTGNHARVAAIAALTPKTHELRVTDVAFQTYDGGRKIDGLVLTLHNTTGTTVGNPRFSCSFDHSFLPYEEDDALTHPTKEVVRPTAPLNVVVPAHGSTQVRVESRLNAYRATNIRNFSCKVVDFDNSFVHERLRAR